MMFDTSVFRNMKGFPRINTSISFKIKICLFLKGKRLSYKFVQPPLIYITPVPILIQLNCILQFEANLSTYALDLIFCLH